MSPSTPAVSPESYFVRGALDGPPVRNECADLAEAVDDGAAPHGVHLPTLAREIIDGTLQLSTLHRPVLLSGACDGADSLFGRHAIAADHEAVHLLGPGDREWASCAAKSGEVGTLLDVGAELLDDPIVSRAFHVAGERRVLGSQRADGWEAKAAAMAARRNFLQVRRAGAVYAVGWRLAKGADQFTGREAVAPGETPLLDVGGGTGWACQWYADRFEDGGEDPAGCQLYFYDDAGPPWALQDEATKGKWSCWDAGQQRWAPLDGTPPPPDGLYAGIGATRLSADAERAIERLYAAPARGSFSR